MNGRVLVGIENNSIGSAIIENLENSSSNPDMFDKKFVSFDYTKFLYVEDSQRDSYKYGINTNVKTKDQMVSIFYDYVTSDPNSICSNDLINQLSIIEKRSNGSVAAKHGHHDDLFMASCFCAYIKKKTITDSAYSTLDKATILHAQQEEDFLLNSVLLTGNVKTRELDIFYSERELLKSVDEFDDFAF